LGKLVNNDAELLRRYVTDRSESAFSSLVTNYLNLVYATALRELRGDSHRAADVVQQVFITLARKAPALIGHPTLAGWLHNTTRHIALKSNRAEQRRTTREQEAYAMGEAHHQEESAPWNEIRPILDWALGRLTPSDREAVLRRFFTGQDFAEIGAALHLSEPAARRRVERALDRLRSSFARRGVVSTAAALTTALTTQGAFAAPVELARAISAAATTVAPVSGLFGLLTLMSINKVATSAAAILICAGLAGFLVQQLTHAQLERQLAQTTSAKIEPAAAERPSVADQTRATADLDALRAQLKDVTAQLASAAPPPTPSVGFVPPEAWKPSGYSTPGDAFETLMAARVSLDVTALGKSITLTPADRELAERRFNELSADAKAKLSITTPEELVAFGWTRNSNSTPSRVVRILGGRLGADEIELRVEESYDHAAPRMSRYTMQRVGADWRWAIRPGEVIGALQSVNKPKK
jgi:RNA polymerase sigma factor (sigma-70 family)